ncbi:DUF3949 domain-containing protein [Halobacillus litoralis]|uniref:DUF3949 domain-containing protein n=1 Tax=Halobacillus litoralis TaxID=45668 RepID=UPI001CD6F1D9|nr:DUF3949 domain-containing protein [Halobacillus litoralis]MCA0971707.1 DUF3949 domain-containing protein [Halobacillus litoralis]
MLIRAIFIILIVFSLITLMMVPIQYRYLIGVKEEQEKKNKSQNQYYEEMPIQEEVLHANSQVNPLFLPANFIAWLILKFQKKL